LDLKASQTQIFHTQTVGLLNTPDEGDSVGNDDVYYGENLNNSATMWQKYDNICAAIWTQCKNVMDG